MQCKVKVCMPFLARRCGPLIFGQVAECGEVREGEGCTWKRSKGAKRHCKLDEAKRKEWW